MPVGVSRELEDHGRRFAITRTGVVEPGHRVPVEADPVRVPAPGSRRRVHAAGRRVGRGRDRLGAEVAGMDAAAVKVVVLDIDRLGRVDSSRRHPRPAGSDSCEVEGACRWADPVIGAVPLGTALDQGGRFAGSRPTTHDDPACRLHDSASGRVANVPGAVPHASTWALTNVTLPYVTALAGKGFGRAVGDDPAPARGADVVRGAVVQAESVEADGLPHVPSAQL